ncbi:MAG: serine/threonine protein phosphatase [Lactobacillales bacterium]|nr:serine/threonine protein phosphatase [Lactobacillales bacterium]
MKNKKTIYKIFLSFLFIGGIYFFQEEKVLAALTKDQQLRLEQIEQKLLTFEAKTKEWRKEKYIHPLTTEYCKDLTQEDISFLKDIAIEAFKQDDIVLQKKLNKLSQMIIVGDIHGDFDATVTYINKSRTLDCPVLFLGDYPDRGFNSYETLAYLFTQKALHPDKIFMIRGNHDFCSPAAESGTFLAELRSKIKNYTSSYIHSDLCRVLDYLPLAAVLSSTETSEKVFCAHAGIIPDLDINQLSKVERPFLLSSQSPFFEMFWTDPGNDSQLKQFQPSLSRPGSRSFNREAFREFLQRNGLTKFVRGHQKSRTPEIILPTPFLNFSDESIVTLHGCVDFCGQGLPGDCAIINGEDLKFEFLRLGLDFEFIKDVKPVTPSDLPPLPPRPKFGFGFGFGEIPIRRDTSSKSTSSIEGKKSITFAPDLPTSSVFSSRRETVDSDIQSTGKPCVEVHEEKHFTKSKAIETCHGDSSSEENYTLPRTKGLVFSRDYDESDEGTGIPFKKKAQDSDSYSEDKP